MVSVLNLAVGVEEMDSRATNSAASVPERAKFHASNVAAVAPLIRTKLYKHN